MTDTTNPANPANPVVRNNPVNQTDRVNQINYDDQTNQVCRIDNDNQTQTKNKLSLSDDFIMSPMVDVCFVNLMRNPIVRKGFCAAILRISPDMIDETEFLPRYLEQEYADDKLGILDVRVRLADGSQINAEMQVRYFDLG